MSVNYPCSRSARAVLLATAAFVCSVPAADQPPTIDSMFPADNVTLTTSSTPLRVTATDPENQPLTVSFYATGGNQAIAGGNFTVGTFPDTQYYSANGTGATCPPDQNGAWSAIYYGQTQWYASNRGALNIAFLSHMGDIVNNGDWCDMQWQIANRAMLTIESPAATGLTFGIPWGGAPGNHDQGVGPSTGRGMASASTAKYNEYFGTSRFAGRPYWGGNYGTNNDNNYQFFSSGGYDFVVIHLEYYSADLDPNYDVQSVLDWADAVLKAHPTRRGIVTTHHMETTSSTFSAFGQQIYNNLRDNPNLVLMLGGHVGISPSATPHHSVTFNGNTVHSSLQDYQSQPNGGNGWLRYFVFSPADKKIYAWTYSSFLNQYGNGSAVPHFSVTHDMAKPVGGWLLVGTVTIPSGSTAEVNWTGLAPNSNYAWYAKVSDGTNTVLSPANNVATGSFTPPGVPPAPTGLTATAGKRKVTLAWNASSGATSYNVKRATVTGGPYTTIASGVTLTSYTNSGLTSGTTYYYVVSGVNASGESANSNEASATAR